MNHTIAVYGSLKEGYPNHTILSGAKSLGHATIEGTMYSLGAFPAVSLTGNTKLNLELYEVDDKTLRRLDILEGSPDFYQRELVETSKGPAYMYVMSGASLKHRYSEVVSGDW